MVTHPGAKMKFEVRDLFPTTAPAQEYAVYAIEPKAGNDAGLVSVFNSRLAAQSLADLLNHVALLHYWHLNPETMGK